MNHPTLIRLLLRGCIVIATVGSAHAEVFKCVDREGHVTLTDIPCKSQLSDTPEAAAPVAAETAHTTVADVPDIPDAAPDPAPAAAAAAAPAPAQAITRISLAASELPSVARQRQAVAARRPAGQPFALDTATLKAARYTLAMRDSVMQQQKLAALR